MPNIYGEETWFNGNVTFYKDVTIGGEFKYDNLSVKILSVENSFSVGDDVKISSGIVTAVNFVRSAGLSSEFLMADGSTTRRYIGVGIGSTPGGSGGNTLGENGDIWYTLC